MKSYLSLIVLALLCSACGGVDLPLENKQEEVSEVSTQVTPEQDPEKTSPESPQLVPTNPEQIEPEPPIEMAPQGPKNEYEPPIVYERVEGYRMEANLTDHDSPVKYYEAGFNCLYCVKK